MYLTAFDPLDLLPAKWRAELAEHEVVPVTSGMGGAHVFRILDRQLGPHYLKIATGADAEHLRREEERTKWLASMDVRVPDVVRQFDGADAFAMTMTALSGRSTERADSDDWRPDVRAMAQAFAALHVLPTNACPFDEALNVRFARARELVRRGAIDVSQFDAHNTGLSPEALFERLEASVPASEDFVVVHGDATLSNLIVGHDRAIGFIDCGNCGNADRYVDLALLVRELAEQFGDEARNLFLDAYGGPPWDERKAAFYCDLYEFF